MINIRRTNSSDTDFLALVTALDEDLKIRDGADHAFYAAFNKTDNIKYAMVASQGEIPVGCGAIRSYAPGVMEVKRMYVLPEYRNQGIASEILKALENWSAEFQCHKILLETGKNQPEAISLYIKNRYVSIPNYGQYADVNNSVCFEKILND